MVEIPFGEYENFEDCVAKNQDKADPEAYCATIKRQIEGDKPRKIGFDKQDYKIGFDKIALDSKIVFEDDKILTMSATIASEIVHEYEDGWAYKPADELEKMATTASRLLSRPVIILKHPQTAFVQTHDDVHGRVTDFKFHKDLIDPKTRRPNRRGVTANISWFKDVVPEDIIVEIKSGALRDDSIGFAFMQDKTPGEWNGQKFDYVQRNIFLDHVAAPIPLGRCPSPFCGIAVDSVPFNAEIDNECPVCKTIRQVGFLTAGRRLYKQYGIDVLEVIEGHSLPQQIVPKEDSEDLIVKSRRLFKELNARLQE